MNPIRAGLVDRAGDWEWSSARYHLGLRTTDYLVRDRDLFELVDDWESYVSGGDEDKNSTLNCICVPDDPWEVINL